MNRGIQRWRLEWLIIVVCKILHSLNLVCWTQMSVLSELYMRFQGLLKGIDALLLLRESLIDCWERLDILLVMSLGGWRWLLSLKIKWGRQLKGRLLLLCMLSWNDLLQLRCLLKPVCKSLKWLMCLLKSIHIDCLSLLLWRENTCKWLCILIRGTNRASIWYHAIEVILSYWLLYRWWPCSSNWSIQQRKICCWDVWMRLQLVIDSLIAVSKVKRVRSILQGGEEILKWGLGIWLFSGFGIVNRQVFKVH